MPFDNELIPAKFYIMRWPRGWHVAFCYVNRRGRKALRRADKHNETCGAFYPRELRGPFDTEKEAKGAIDGTD